MRVYFKTLDNGNERVHRIPRIGDDVEVIVSPYPPTPHRWSLSCRDASGNQTGRKTSNGCFQNAIAEAYEIVKQGGYRVVSELEASR